MDDADALARAADGVGDRIVLAIPAVHGYRGVATLVLGGVGSRVGLPYERMDDLQLAVLSVLESAAENEVVLEVEAAEDVLTVSVGPLAEGVAADRSLTTVLDRLVDGADEHRRDGRSWLRFRLSRLTGS